MSGHILSGNESPRHPPLCKSWDMRSQDSATTRRDDYIVHMLPWAHGHQRNAIRDFVRAIIDQQTGCQAQLARSFGKQEAAVKRLSRLLHNERLEPRHLADAVLLQALTQLPATVQCGWPSTGRSRGTSICWSSPSWSGAGPCLYIGAPMMRRSCKAACSAMDSRSSGER